MARAWRFCLAVAVAGLFAALPVQGDAADRPEADPKNHTDATTPPKPERIMVAGRKRFYSLFIPPHITGPAPLVMVLHGGKGKVTGARRFGFDALARQYGFVVAYPEADQHHWNDGRVFTGRFAGVMRADDVGFLRALVDRLVAEGRVDARRVAVTGFSDGGMMALRLGCVAGDMLAALAPVMAGLPEGLLSSCAAGAPLPLLLMTGTEDQVVPVKGGPVMPFFSQRRDVADRGRVAPLARTLRLWTQRNQCLARPPLRRWLPDPDPFNGVRTEVSHWTGCQAPVTHYSIAGGGHQWPGQPLPLGTGFADRFLGRGTPETDAAPVIAAFFQAIWQGASWPPRQDRD